MSTIREFYEGKNVLVTGHKGFIGGKLCERLKGLGAKVFGLDSPGDVSNIYQVRSAFDDSPSVVFHLAAKTEVRASLRDPMRTYKTNVMGALNILEVCRERKVPSLVIASTDKVYGDRTLAKGMDKYSCKETDELFHNADIYASSKRAADELAQDYCRVYRMPIRILRCANVYGPGQRNATTLLTGTITRILDGERPVVFLSSRYHVREWLFINDAIDAYLLAGLDAANYTVSSPVFNVGSRDQFSVDAVVGMCLTAFGKSVFDYDLEADTSPQISDQGLDSYKFRAKFPQWTTTPFPEGLRRTIEWYKEMCK